MEKIAAYEIRRDKAIDLLESLFTLLTTACEGKKSTNDITSERLLWEIHNKLFSIIRICENSLRTKDSLSVHLVARYTYEILIIFLYIFLDKTNEQTRVEAFLNFRQFDNAGRSWMESLGKSGHSDLVKDLPDKLWVEFHKKHYRTLSTFAHPTIESFLLNRRGIEAEYSMIISTSLLVSRAIQEIIEQCLSLGLYYSSEQRHFLLKELPNIIKRAEILMKENIDAVP